MIRLVSTVSLLLFVGVGAAFAAGQAAPDGKTGPINTPYVSSVGETVPKPGTGIRSKEKDLQAPTATARKDDSVSRDICKGC